MSEIDELVQFLDHDQENIRHLATEYLLGLSHGGSLELLLVEPRVHSITDQLAKRLQDEPVIAHNAIKCLINLATNSTVALTLNRPDLHKTLLMLILEPRSVLADLACMLMSNLSQTTEVVQMLLKQAPLRTLRLPAEIYIVSDSNDRNKDTLRYQFMSKSLETILAMPTGMDQLVEVFNRGLTENGQKWYNANADFNFLASVFANVSKHAEGRRFLLESVVSRFPKSNDHLKPTIADENDPVFVENTSAVALNEGDTTTALTKLLCYTEHSSLVRRGGIVSLVKNLTFSLQHHPDFLDPMSPIYILQALVIPLAPADFADKLLSEDDFDSIPDWLLSLPKTHFIETHVALRRCLLESLLVLMSTRSCRNTLRAQKVYYVFRERHKTENDPACILLMERCVNMLMRDDNLNDVENVNELLQSVDDHIVDEEMGQALQER